MYGKIILAALALFVCGTIPAVAQFSPQNIVRHHGMHDGLSQGVVNSIASDAHSFIWIATEDGLNRFDGYRFKVFKHARGRTTGLSGNFVQALLKDKDGTLWVSSREGLQRFDPTLETFTLYTNGLKIGGSSTPLNDVSAIAEGASGNLWVSWYAHGFGSFHKETGKFTVYNQGNLPSLSSGQTISILDDGHDMLWVGGQDAGLNVFNIRNGQVIDKVDALSDPALLPSRNIRCTVKDQRNNVWIGTSQGLVVYLRGRNQLVNFNFHPSIREKNILSLLADSNDNLWIGTQGHGIYRLDLRQFDTHKIEQFAITPVESLDGFDISSKSVQAFYEDDYKNIWLGTFGDGVYMVSSEKQKFIRFQKMINKGSSFTSASFYGMCHDQGGNLWLGTDGNGIYKLSPAGDHDAHFRNDGKPGSITDNSIQSAFCDTQGRIWFGTYAQGLFQFDSKSNTFSRYHYVDSKGPRKGANDVRVIFEDTKHRIWAGTNRGGLCLADPATRTVANLQNAQGILRDGDIRSVAQNASGEIWLGFYGDGLQKFDPATNTLTPWFHDPDAPNFIGSRIILSLGFDDSDRLWIGTAESGVYVYDFQSKKLTAITEENGLANNAIYAILLDKNTCWVSTNSGVSKIESATLAVTNYDVLDGLQHGQFNPGAGMFNKTGGYMCFGGSEGLNVLYPGQVKAVIQKPKANITGLQLFNRPVSVRDTVDGKVILQQVINTAKEIELEHDQSVITFEFIGLNYSYPEKLEYAYKLEGLDTKWNDVGGQRSATYRYLKPGRYEFKVRAFNREDAGHDHKGEYASLAVLINPPLYQTPLAYTLYALAVVALGAVAYRVGSKQLSLRKRLQLEKEQRKQEQRLAMDKLAFFTEISHEFRTPLTLIIGPIEEMLSQEDKHSAQARKLQMIHRSAAKLLNLINKLLDYRRIESGQVMLQVRQTDMIPFVREIYESFQDAASKKNIAYTFHTEVPALTAWFDIEKMEMVLTNLLANSLKYIGQGNEIGIYVSVRLSEQHAREHAVIQIKDDGIGIPKKHLRNIFEWFYKGENSDPMNSGIGLSLARKLVLLHKGNIAVESTEGKGSTFSVEIPLGRDHFQPEAVTFLTDETPSDTVPTALPIDDDIETPAKRAVPSVLIMEDDDDIRSFLREYFEKTYKIFEAANGTLGLEIANTHHPDLIISDIMMPGPDGIEICKLLKSNVRTSHIPIILLTAKTSMIHHKQGIEVGADAYITKPFSPDILSLTVGNLLQSRHQLMMYHRNLFVNNGMTNGKETQSPDEAFLQTVFEQFRKNLDKPDFNVAELSDGLHMSRSLVYRKIKMLTGLSPTEYIRTLRMQEAAKLLKTHRYKVFEVVYMVGFSDLKYFRQCFVKEFGVSPSEYMKQPEEGI